MKLRWWIKFDNAPPELWMRDTFEAMWYDIREFMLRQGRMIEWIIND
jgi:hypothetical protein